MFADDAKLYSSVENAIDSTVLQSVLDKIVAWADYWQLTINIYKLFIYKLYSHLIDVETLATLKCGKHSTSARYSIDELS